MTFVKTLFSHLLVKEQVRVCRGQQAEEVAHLSCKPRGGNETVDRVDH